MGRAEIGAEAYSSELRFNGVEAVGFAVTQLPTANALDVYEQVLAELTRLEKNFPPGMKYQVSFDTATVVQDSIREVVITLLEAIGLVVLVMFLFLQDWRSTIIPTITIPVSLVGTFAFIKLLGFSINTLTLFGIVLATGIVVDDAIVVIENIQRHIQEYGRTARQAASEAMREVLGAVIATGLVLIAVFVPVAFFPGTTGRLYQQFSLTIAFAVALSVFNAVTLTPALSALLLRKESQEGTLLPLLRADHRGGHATSTRDCSVGAIRIRWVMAALFVAALGLTYWVYQRVPQAFLPDEDQGYFIAQIQAPEGASLEYTSNVARQVEAVLAKEKDIASAFSVMGFSFSGASPNRGLLFIRLKPFDERREDSQSAQAVVGRLRGALGGISGAIVVPFLPPPIRGLGAFGGFQFELLDQTGGPIENLAVATTNLVRAGNQQPQLRGLFSAFTAGDPQLSVDIDRDRVKSLNMPLSEVTDALQVYLGLAVRQRLRLQQPRVSRLRPGRPAVPQRSQGPGAVLRARAERGDGAAVEPRARAARRRRRRSSATSTCFDRPRSTARPRPASARVRRCWPCRTWPSARCRRACRTRGPGSRSRRSRPARSRW